MARDLHYNQARYTLETDQRGRSQLPCIVTGVQPVGCSEVVLRSDITGNKSSCHLGSIAATHDGFREIFALHSISRRDRMPSRYASVVEIRSKKCQASSEEWEQRGTLYDLDSWKGVASLKILRRSSELMKALQMAYPYLGLWELVKRGHP